MKEKDRKCSKCGCSAQDPDTTLHRFPMPGRTNSFKCESWAKFCFPNDSWSSPKFQNSLYSRHLMLCTKHFNRRSFMDRFGRRLGKSAVPSTEEPNSLEQSDMYQQLSSFSEDCLKTDEIDITTSPPLLCICCLGRSNAYINLNTCTHADFLDSFVKPEMKPNDQVICYQCHNMLKKIKLFKLQVENSFKLLSESVDHISQNGQQKQSLKKYQILKIDIPSTWKRNLRTRNRRNPQTKRPKTKTAIDKIEDVPKTKTTEPQTISETPKTNVGDNLLKKNKNIEDALKIININQNSGCINLLASSLQTISCTLLGSIYKTNSETGNQISAPNDYLFSINTPTTTIAAHNSTANITTVLKNTNLEIGNQISATTNIFPNMNTPTTTNSTYNSSANIITELRNTKLEIGNQINAPTDIDPDMNTLITTNVAHNARENIITGIKNTKLEIGSQINAPTDIDPDMNTLTTTNVAHNATENIITGIKNTKLEIGSQINAPTDTVPNINTPTTKIVAQNTNANIINEIKNTNLETGNQMSSPTDILNSTSTTEAATSTPTYNTTENNGNNLKIVNHTIPPDMLLDIYSPTIRNVTAVSNETVTLDNTTENNETLIDDDITIQCGDSDSIEAVADKESLPFAKDESNDGGRSNMQTNKLVTNKPSLGSNIRQLTLKREQLMEERAKIASSQLFLRLPHRCDSCLIGFQFRENLDDHVKRKHIQERMRNPEQCDVCLQFVESDSYDKHLFLHLTRFECVTCSQQFASYEKAALHYKKLHRVNKPKTVLKCPQCSFKTEHMLRLKRHVRRVTRCKTCGDGITHGCGTGTTYNRHVARCKGPRS